MIKLISIVLVMLVGCTMLNSEVIGPPLIQSSGQSYIRLTKEPCGTLKDFYRGDSNLQGTQYSLCWKSMLQEGTNRMYFRLFFDDGDARSVDPSGFKPEDKI